VDKVRVIRIPDKKARGKIEIQNFALNNFAIKTNNIISKNHFKN
jgi:hypothetical protein